MTQKKLNSYLGQMTVQFPTFLMMEYIMVSAFFSPPIGRYSTVVDIAEFTEKHVFVMTKPTRNGGITVP